MYDSYGKFIRTIDGAGKDTRNLDINISDLPSGIYYIVMNAGAKSERYKFVKI